MLLEIFLRSLAQNTSLPWCILGDFNDIFDAREKWGVLQDPSDLSMVLDKRYMICVYGRINGYSSIYTFMDSLAEHSVSHGHLIYHLNYLECTVEASCFVLSSAKNPKKHVFFLLMETIITCKLPSTSTFI